MAKQTVYQAECNAVFHPTMSNDKLGGKKQKIMAVSYVPGNELLYLKNGTLVSDCIGTCGKVDCNGCAHRGVCYAIDSFCQYNAVTLNRVENTLQLRSDMAGHFEEIYQAAIEKGVNTIRYTESGEIESYEQFLEVVRLSERLPGVEIYLYTKNYPVLYRFFKSRELPENMTVLISIWENVGVAAWNDLKEHAGIKAFVVNNDAIKCDAMCPAYRKDDKGKVRRVKSDAVKCGNCRLCTRARKAKVIGCLEH